MRQWVNHCNSPGYVVSGDTGRCDCDLSDRAYYSQQNLSTFQTRSLILSRNFRRNFHYIGNINASISKIIDTNDRHTVIGLSTRLNDAVSY